MVQTLVKRQLKMPIFCEAYGSPHTPQQTLSAFSLTIALQTLRRLTIFDALCHTY